MAENKAAEESWNVIEALAPLATKAPAPLTQSEPRVLNVRRIREQMSLLTRTSKELQKIEELNANVPKDLGFTLVMYSEDGKEIGFVHNITKWDPSTLLNNE